MNGGGEQVTNTRRTYLRRVALGAMAGLAGCSRLGLDNTPDNEGEPAPTETETSTPTASTGEEIGLRTPTVPPGTPVTTVSGAYRGYRGGPGRQAAGFDARTPESATVAYVLDLSTAVYQPVVDGTRLYLTRHNRGVGDPTVEAFDVQYGVRLWSRNLEATATGPPAVAGDRLFVGTEAGTHALDPAGRVVWEAPEGAAVEYVPAVTDDRAYVLGQGGLTAFSHNGIIEWTIPIGNMPVAAPAVSDGGVYVPIPRNSGSTDVVLFDESGESRWRQPVRVDSGYPLVATSETVYAASGLVQGGVVALETGTGEIQWRNDIQPPRPPAVVGDRVVAASDSSLYTYDLTGETVWETDLGDAVLAGPVASEDGVYVAVPGNDAAAVVLAFGIDDGTVRWSLPTDRPLAALPAVLDGGLVVTTHNGDSGSERLLVVTGE